MTHDPATSAPGGDAARVDPADLEDADAPAPGDEAGGEQPDDGDGDEDALAEIELDGRTWKVPAALKDGYLRQADYTRKTQDVAERGRALSAREQALAEREQDHAGRTAEQAKAQDALVDLRADIRATREHIAAYETLVRRARDAGDLTQAQDLALSRLELREKLDQLTEAERQVRGHLTDHEQRAAQAAAQARQAEIAKGARALAADPQVRLTQAAFEAVAGHLEKTYGIAQPRLLAALAEPELYRVARDAARVPQLETEIAALKQATAQSELRPASTVGSSAGAARPATTDPRSDRLPIQVWMAQERERQRRRAGR